VVPQARHVFVAILFFGGGRRDALTVLVVDVGFTASFDSIDLVLRDRERSRITGVRILKYDTIP
jgi:hypothetical protein